MRVRVPSPRSGSIWKMPPFAQSFACRLMDRPGPVRDSVMSVPLISTLIGLVSLSPRWSGTLLA